MTATPFAFPRGSAGLMAYGLARTPTTRVAAQLHGDAHAADLGLHGDAHGGLVVGRHGPTPAAVSAAKATEPTEDGGRRFTDVPPVLCRVPEAEAARVAPFPVRQFRDRRGSVDPAAVAADQIGDYARVTGALPARAHAHSAGPRLIAGCCGKGGERDAAVAAFAVACADRTEAGHAVLLTAVRSGPVAAETGV